MKSESISMNPNWLTQFGQTLGSAVGMLVCGLAGAAIGALLGSEWMTGALAAVGMVGGSALGAVTTGRWLRRNDANPSSE